MKKQPIKLKGDEMQFAKFKNASGKQVEAMMLIIPKPIGEGLTYEESAKKLGINKSAFIKRISGFKNRCPKAWDEIESVRRSIGRQKEGMERPFNFEEDILNRYINKIHDGSIEPNWELVEKMQEVAMRLNVIESGMTSIDDGNAFNTDIAIDENRIKDVF